MDALDLAILKAVQEEFPLEARPYEDLARRLGLSADAVHARVMAMKRDGRIRRLAPMFDRAKLGFHGGLVAAKVRPDAVDSLARLLDGKPEVTHNYLRAGSFNVWFTAMLNEGETLDGLVREVRAIEGVSEVIALPSRKVFKLDTSFELERDERPEAQPSPRGASPSAPQAVAALDSLDRRIVGALQAGLSDSATPYADAAAGLAITENELLRRLRRMLESGLLRRVRALLDQRRVGLEGNALVAWCVPESRADEVGRMFAGHAEVSHCVLRDTAAGWPYNLYTMIHADSLERCRQLAREMETSAGVGEPVVLETLRELKKTPPRYF